MEASNKLMTDKAKKSTSVLHALPRPCEERKMNNSQKLILISFPSIRDAMRWVSHKIDHDLSRIRLLSRAVHACQGGAVSVAWGRYSMHLWNITDGKKMINHRKLWNLFLWIFSSVGQSRKKYFVIISRDWHF